ncbi:MAG: DNA topoisomerase IV subunit B [Gammaproteobacteria bacterium]|nr:DNA topoisomerase IV subunit B [Gammaproteobacteria bacterium]MBT7323400.1 DNA topoisomerase IV subunit B [Gammaproteobacteria bacterium]
MKKKYTSSDIEVLKGIEPVQKRPGMYTDTTNPNHLVQELIDNSVDEAISGHCNEIIIHLHDNNLITVDDNGRGMPVDPHPKHKVSGVEVIMTNLHSGAKFSEKNYKYSGGLHGVGVSVVNALSESLMLQISRLGDSKEYSMSFKNGKLLKGLKSSKKTSSKKQGTIITFKANPEYFDSLDINIQELSHLVKAKSILQPKLKLKLIDEKHGSGTQEFYHDGSLSDYLIGANTPSTDYLPNGTYHGTINGDTYVLDWSAIWLPESTEPLQESYVNLIPTMYGGTHVNAFRTGLIDSMREFCDRRNLLPRNIKLSPEDIWKNVSFILSFKMSNPQFSGQTKGKLQSNHLLASLTSQLKDKFALWLNKHSDAGEKLAELAIKNAQVRILSSNSDSKKINARSVLLPSRLSDCTLKDIKVTELFLVEGDSAGGSAKQARDRTYQAILPLRGKILNTWELSSAKILESKEVKDISTSIGVVPGSDDISKLRYGKICVLADADSDGLHIATLLAALFYKHFYPLVEAGHIYISKPPLFRIDYKKETHYVIDEAEKKSLLKKLKLNEKDSSVSITRFKGLGEMNPTQLRDTTLSKKTRKLVELTLSSSNKDKSLMDMLLSKKKSSERKAWLEKKGDLAKID